MQALGRSRCFFTLCPALQSQHRLAGMQLGMVCHNQHILWQQPRWLGAGAGPLLMAVSHRGFARNFNRRGMPNYKPPGKRPAQNIDESDEAQAT